MQIAILTSAPDFIDTYLSNTILRQAMLNESVSIHVIDIRNHAKGNYKQIDDTPFGGGSGMILMAIGLGHPCLPRLQRSLSKLPQR